ncbi:MAG TPA: RagB/SusD family nutrient uptake outer membrane protein [Agriterribacter sp.]|nr:RagB/SusD family nutrient uptake outer membrane protein [Agriterribacter sp.]
MKLLLDKVIFAIILLSMVFTSCKKYLAAKPDDKLTVPTTLADLQAILDFTNVMNIKTTPAGGSSASDDYFLIETTFNSLTEVSRNIYTWRLSDYYYPNDWSQSYSPVYNANYCLEQIEKIKITDQTEQEWKNIKGSALFFRSYYFMHLLWNYSMAYDSVSYDKDKGIVLRLGSDFNVPSVRSSVKECYDRVIHDAKLAAMNLTGRAINTMRPSKAAAYGLLAKAYLSMRIYDSAFKYSNLCLQLNNDLIDYNDDPDINGSIAADVPFKRFPKEVIFYSEMNTYYMVNSASRAKIDTVLYSMYDTEDLRKIAFFRSSSGYQRFKCIYTGSSTYYFTGIATDEMYLVRAECLARAGDTQGAMADLNALLVRRWKAGTFVPLTASNPSEALKIILIERRKELLMRGVRWMDIKRFNKENAVITLKRMIAGQEYKLQPNDNYYALPLPKDIIQATGISQNE